MKKRFLLIGITICLMVFALGVASASAEVVTWNPDDKGSNVTLSNGNLTAFCNTYVHGCVRATEGKNTGKWYWEITRDSGGQDAAIGIATNTASDPTGPQFSSEALSFGYYGKYIYYQGNRSETSLTYSTSDGTVYGIALDLNNNIITCYVNNQPIPELTNYSIVNIVTGDLYPIVGAGNTSSASKYTANFGATPFTYPIPEGYQPFDGSGQPQVPINLVATAGNSQVNLSWTAVSGATSYKVKRSTTAGGSYTEIATDVTTTTYTDTTVTNGTTYYYVITAVTSGSESGNSNEASATPQAGTTPPPSGVGNALLRIIMVDSSEREYQLTMTDVNAFISWFETKGASTPYYMFNKTYNIGPFSSRKNYVAYDKIIDFEVMGY